MKCAVALLAAVVIAGIEGGAAAAYADDRSTARLATTGVTAAGHGASDCGDFPPDAPGAGRDGWVFQSPARFASVRLEFGEGDGRSTLVDLVAGHSGEQAWAGRFFDNGTELWLSTPAGWTLRSGSAEIMGNGGAGFDLIRTCWGQEPVARLSGRADAERLAGGAGSAVQKIVVVIAPTGTRPPSSPSPGSRPPSSMPPASATPGHATGPAGHLPKTGEPIAVLVAVAAALIIVGAALRLVRRTEV